MWIILETSTELLEENTFKELEELPQKERLRALRDMKRSLIEKVRGVEKERAEYKTERDELNQKVKEMFQIAKETREKRDQINEDVRLNKALRDLRQEDVNKVVKELETLEEQMREIGIVRPGRGSNRYSNLHRRIQDLELKYQTMPNLTREKEREMVQTIENLTLELERVEVVEGKREEFRTINRKLKKLRADALGHHKEVNALAEKSQEFHEEMMKQLSEAKAVRSEADAKHKKILELNDEIKGVRKKINKVAVETDKLRKAMGQETTAERSKRKADAAKKAERDLNDRANEVLKRYQAGEKLGFEDFKLLISKGLLKK